MRSFCFLRSVTAAAFALLATLSPAVANDQEIDLSGFKLTFSDEFNGDQLDALKWQASGIPDPEFNPYHKTVFDFLARRERLSPGDSHWIPTSSVLPTE